LKLQITETEIATRKENQLSVRSVSPENARYIYTLWDLKKMFWRLNGRMKKWR